jgi:hypothetical protein
MIRIANRLAVAGLLLAVACSSSSGSATVIGMTFTLQGVVADALNGKRIGDDLKLYLVQGATIRGPSRLINNTGDPLAGEYAFTGIPVEFGNGNNMWKLVAIKTGYQRFESEFNLLAVTGSGIVDTVYNKIGNIYLFPVGVPSPDYTFTTTYNNKPVGGATVQLDPISASNAGTFVVGAGDTLAATNGYVASVTQTTDATTGKGTVAGSNLAVGAAYKVTVLPVSFKDSAGTTVQLGTFTGITFIAGLGVTDIPITLVKVNATNPAVLYLTGASNRGVGQLAADGKLTITFSAPVSVVNANCFDAPAGGFSAGSNAAGTAAGAGVLSTTAPVTATLTDPQTLVLAPNYTTPPAATDRGVHITYANGPPAASTTCPLGGAILVPKDYPALAFTLFGGGGLKFSDGTTGVSGLVNITGP